MGNASTGGNAFVPVVIGGTGTAAESYGASPAATAPVNTIAINTALAQGGLVTLNIPGIYTVGSSAAVSFNGNTYALCLSIPSNTRFVLGQGVVLQVAGGLTNPVLIQNTNANGAGDTNISVEGGQWDGNKPNVTRSDGTCMCAFLIWFTKVTNLDLRRMWWSNSVAYHSFLSSLKTYRVQDIRIYDAAPAINGDGVHIHGNCVDGTVRNISGNTGDDLIAALSYDPSHSYTTPLDAGPITDLLIDGVVGDETAGAWHLLDLSGSLTPAYPLSNLVIRNVSGRYTDGGILVDGGLAGLLTIDGVSAQPLAGSNPTYASVALRGGSDDVVNISNVHRVVADSVETGTKQGPVVVYGFTWNCIKLSAVHLEDTTAAGAGTAVYQINTGATVSASELTNISSITSLSTGNGAMVSNSGTLGSLMVANCRTTNVRQMLYTQGNITTGVYFSNVHGNGNQANAFFFNGAVTIPHVSLSAVKLDGTQATNGCLRFISTTGSALVQMHGCSFNVNGTTNPVVARSASESIRVQSMDTPVPSGILTPSRGDIILDSNTTALASSDGTNWFFDGPATVAIAYAATITPVMIVGTANGGNVLNVAALTAAITVANPATIPPSGARMTFNLVQNATGGFAVSWGAAYQFPVAFTNTGNTASTRTSVSFVSDGTNLWAQGQNAWH